MAKYRQYAKSVSNVNEQMKLFDDPKDQLIRGNTLEVIEEYIKRIKDPDHGNLVNLKEIEFEAKGLDDKIETDELEACNMHFEKYQKTNLASSTKNT